MVGGWRRDTCGSSDLAPIHASLHPFKKVDVYPSSCSPHLLFLAFCRPPSCPDYLYELMSECLEHSSENRPGVADIVVYLDKLNDETKPTEVESD